MIVHASQKKERCHPLVFLWSYYRISLFVLVVTMMMDGVSGLCQRTKKNFIGTKNNEIYSWRRACAQTYGMVLSLRLLVFWKIPLLCANVSRVDSLVVAVVVVVVQNKVGTTTLDPKQALGWTFQS